jgi:dihydroxyacetone kinase
MGVRPNNALAKELEERGIKVVGNMVGEILTVQEAGGFQMNLAKWDDEIERLWNTPAHTPVFYKEQLFMARELPCLFFWMSDFFLL